METIPRVPIGEGRQWTKSRWIKYFEKAWDIDSRFIFKTDWLGLEQALVEALSSQVLSGISMLRVSRELIDVYTRHGHFTEGF